MKFMETSSIHHLKTGLKLYSLRQRVISSNIANVSTPGYTAKYVPFEEYFQNRLSSVSTSIEEKGFLPIGRKRIDEVKIKVKDSKKPVSIEREMTEAAENRLNYEYSIMLIKSQYSRLITAIKGR